MRLDALFKPIKIGGMEIKNRLAVPPMGTNYAEADFSVSQRMVEYYRARAWGGFGLITIEFTAVQRGGVAAARQLGLWEDRQVNGFRKLAEAVHSQGAKLSVQLHHGGRQTLPALCGGQPVAPSAIPCPELKSLPREMSSGEVYETINAFVEAAQRVKAAGADAVELHGAHGYLMAEFMSAYANRRTDEFGGSLHNRMRFPRLIIEGIRERLGSFPIIFRISSEEKTVDGRGIAETRAVCRLLEEMGVDALDVSAGVYGSFPWIWGAGDAPYGYSTKFAEDIKKTVNIPVIGVGRIMDPAMANELVETGRLDMVALGRQSLAEPHWPRLVQRGDHDDISPCIGCHQGCTEQLFQGNNVTCVVNPLCGNEADMPIERAERRKKVMVIGGGPGGLYAAMLLKLRGHSVALYEREAQPGGQLRAAAMPPGKADFARAAAYYRHMCEKLGVELTCGMQVSTELISAKRPDAVVLATGGVQIVPDIPGVDGRNIVLATDLLLGKKQVAGRVLIAGGGMTGIECADYLGQYGCDITVVEMADAVGADVNEMVKKTLMPRLSGYGVKFITGARITEFSAGGATYEKAGKDETLSGFDNIVLALGVKPNNPLESAAREVLSEVYVIGGAAGAARLLDVARQAAEVGLKV